MPWLDRCFWSLLRTDLDAAQDSYSYYAVMNTYLRADQWQRCLEVCRSMRLEVRCTYRLVQLMSWNEDKYEHIFVVDWWWLMWGVSNCLYVVMVVYPYLASERLILPNWISVGRILFGNHVVEPTSEFCTSVVCCCWVLTFFKPWASIWKLGGCPTTNHDIWDRILEVVQRPVSIIKSDVLTLFIKSHLDRELLDVALVNDSFTSSIYIYIWWSI